MGTKIAGTLGAFSYNLSPRIEVKRKLEGTYSRLLSDSSPRDAPWSVVHLLQVCLNTFFIIYPQ